MKTELPRHILAATDFSDSADAARDVAAQYARVLHARLHLLHVFTAGEIDTTQLLADAAGRWDPTFP